MPQNAATGDGGGELPTAIRPWSTSVTPSRAGELLAD
jgi:hypothetical protein